MSVWNKINQRVEQDKRKEVSDTWKVLNERADQYADVYQKRRRQQKLADVRRKYNQRLQKSQQQAQQARKYGSYLEGIKNFPKAVGKEMLETGAVLGDVATRLSPVEGVRNIASGVKEAFTGPKAMPVQDRFMKGVADSRSRKTLFERVSGQDLETAEGQRDFIISGAEAPTYAFGVGKGALMQAGKPFLKRAALRTKNVLPEIGVEAGLMTAEEGDIKSAPRNLATAGALIGGLSNIGGEVSKFLDNRKIAKKASEYVNEARKKGNADSKQWAKVRNIGNKTNPTDDEIEEVYKVIDDIKQNKIGAKVRDFERAEGLTAKDKKIESAAFNKILNRENQILNSYKKKHGSVINTDDFRKEFKDVGYRGYNSAAVQEPASYLSKKAYKKELQNEGKYMLATSGGSGAGKTSALNNLNEFNNIKEKSAVTLDSNLSGYESAKKKLIQARKSGKEPVVFYVYRDPKDAYTNGVVKRMKNNKEEGGRIVPNKVVAENHVGSWNVAKKLKKDGVDVRFVDNSRGKNKAQIVSASDIEKKIKKYNDTQRLKKIFDKEAKRLREIGEVTDEQYDNYVRGDAKKEVVESLKPKSEAMKTAKKPKGDVKKDKTEGPDEVNRVANNLIKNNPGLQRKEAEAMAKDIISNRKYAEPATDKTSAPTKKAEETPKKPTRDRKKSTFAKRLNQDLPDNYKIDEEYSVAKMEDEINKAVDLVNDDKQKALEIAMGIRKADGNTQTAVSIALAEKAKKQGDWDTVARLYNNRRLSNTRRGQEIAMEKTSVAMNPQEKYMRQVIDARMENIKLGKESFEAMKKGRKQLAQDKIARQADDMKKNLTKSYKLSEAQKLLDNITC